MKKFTEKYRLNYFAAFLIMCLMALYYGYNLAMHLRIYNILWLFCTLMFARFLYIDSKKGVKPSIYEFGKTYKTWDKRRKAAKKAGEEFNEACPRKPANTTEYILLYFCGYMVALFMATIVSVFLFALIPFHWTHEYKNERPEVHTEVNFFPEDIPEGAEKVRWEVFPSFLQGKGYFALKFKADKGYIEDIVSKYGGDAVKVEDQADNIRRYTMYISGDEYSEGFIVYKDHDRITFFVGDY